MRHTIANGGSCSDSGRRYPACRLRDADHILSRTRVTCYGSPTSLPTIYVPAPADFYRSDTLRVLVRIFAVLEV